METPDFICIGCKKEFVPAKDTTHNAQNWSAWKMPIVCPHCGKDNTVDFILAITKHEDWDPNHPYNKEL